MENTEKVEIGYTVPKERWQEAAKNLEELGNVLAAGFLKQNKDGRGKEDADALMADIVLACMALHHVAEFATDKCRIIPLPGTEVNMLAVLMSMKPKWWEKILDGEKTLEIRKTHPQNERLEWPVTVLVYVSGTGAVQGQFLCPGEVSYRTMQDLEEMSCVPREDLLKYAKGRRLSGWIVQSPEKFDAPSPLAEFGLDRPPMSWQYVEIPDAAEE